MGNAKKFLLIGAALILSGAILLSRPSVKNQRATPLKETALPQASAPQVSGESGEQFLVTRVIDGDTIVLESGERVRYIGIDAPEISRGEQCFSQESKLKNKELVEGKQVRLEKDVSERDRYKRLLRYIYIDDIFVNDYLVRQGYAKAYTYPPDVKYSSQFVEAEKEAREGSRGLWAGCSSPTPTSSVQPLTIGNQTSSVDCSHNAYNCTDFKTQSEAQSVFDYCMRAVRYDVHKLDKDKDGRVCETLH